VPLEVGDLGARQEDVLAGAGRRLFLLDLELHNVGRVLDDLGDVGAMAGADLTQYTLVDPHHTADEPPTLYTKLAYEPINEKLG
jgi:hypothetical protein